MTTALRMQARGASRYLRLPFQRQSWRGTTGHWAGAAHGISIDFHDHRPYQPGDDVRHIDWPAYARTGQYIMKLYREEVSPKVDLVLDRSRSMRCDPAKTARALELFLFCAESASRAGASLHALTVSGDHVQRLPPGDLPADRLLDERADERGGSGYPAIERIPLRSGSLRVVISDLLFPGEPERMLHPLGSARGRGVILAPFTADEARPAWTGSYAFVDCETRTERSQRIHTSLLERYREAYGQHFRIWREAARRIGIPLAHLPVETELTEALRDHALPQGAVESWI